MRTHLHNVNLHIAVIYTFTIFNAEYLYIEERNSDNKNLLHVDKDYDNVLGHGCTKSMFST